MSVGDMTVVMITRDRLDSTLRSVAALTALPERPPVVVVDNGSSDGTVAALAQLPGVEVIAAGQNLGSAGRTLGVRAARTPYVAFADDDSWWAPGALRRAAELFDHHPRLGLIAGRTLVGPEAREDPMNASLADAPMGREPGLPGPRVLGFLACAAAVRRVAYLEVGGFHPKFGVGGEEQLLALDLAAAGWQLCYVPDVVAHHHPAREQDRPGRPVRQRRNDLWTAWLRWRAMRATGRTAAIAFRALTDPAARDVLKASLPAVPWIVAQRRPVPRPLQRMLAAAERAAGG